MEHGVPPGDGGGHEVLPPRQADVEAETEGEEVGELDDAEGAGVQFNRHFSSILCQNVVSV